MAKEKPKSKQFVTDSYIPVNQTKMYQKFIQYALFFSVIVSLALVPVFAEIEFDSGPLQEKPLDERQQEDKETTEIWIYAIILVIIFIIIRIAFGIIKKRMKPKKD